MATTCKLIAKAIVSTSGTSQIEFTNIPSAYDDLLVLVSTRENNTNSWVSPIRLNGATTGYTIRWIGLYGSSISSGSATTDSIINGLIASASNTTANSFANSSIYIPNYARSTNKSVMTESVGANNSSSEIYLRIGAALWSSTAAVTSIAILVDPGGLAQNSSAYLYGIKKF